MAHGKSRQTRRHLPSGRAAIVKPNEGKACFQTEHMVLGRHKTSQGGGGGRGGTEEKKRSLLTVRSPQDASRLKSCNLHPRASSVPERVPIMSLASRSRGRMRGDRLESGKRVPGLESASFP